MQQNMCLARSVEVGQQLSGLLLGTEEVCTHGRTGPRSPLLVDVGLKQQLWAAWVKQRPHDSAKWLRLKGFAAKNSHGDTICFLVRALGCSQCRSCLYLISCMA